MFNCAVVIICSLKEKAEFIRHQHYCLVFASLNCWRLRLTIDAQFTTEGVLKWTPKKWPHKDQVVAPRCWTQLLAYMASERVHCVSFPRFFNTEFLMYLCFKQYNYHQFSGILEKNIIFSNKKQFCQKRGWGAWPPSFLRP